MHDMQAIEALTVTPPFVDPKWVKRNYLWHPKKLADSRRRMEETPLGWQAGYELWKRLERRGKGVQGNAAMKDFAAEVTRRMLLLQGRGDFRLINPDDFLPYRHSRFILTGLRRPEKDHLVIAIRMGNKAHRFLTLMKPIDGHFRPRWHFTIPDQVIWLGNSGKRKLERNILSLITALNIPLHVTIMDTPDVCPAYATWHHDGSWFIQKDMRGQIGVVTGGQFWHGRSHNV